MHPLVSAPAAYLKHPSPLWTTAHLPTRLPASALALLSTQQPERSSKNGYQFALAFQWLLAADRDPQGPRLPATCRCPAPPMSQFSLSSPSLTAPTVSLPRAFKHCPPLASSLFSLNVRQPPPLHLGLSFYGFLQNPELFLPCTYHSLNTYIYLPR